MGSTNRSTGRPSGLLADQVGTAAHALMPLCKLIEAHVLVATRIHGDDTSVPVMAKGKTDVARLCLYIRNDRPFAGSDSPVALFHQLGDRCDEHPQTRLAVWSSTLQSDAYSNYRSLYCEGHYPSPVLETGCFTQ
jgi:transposase